MIGSQTPARPSGTVSLGVDELRAQDVVAVAREGWRVILSAEGRTTMSRSRSRVEALCSSGVPIYGVSTGFGALASVSIEPEKRRLLQESLVRSHAAGVGPGVEAEVVRAMMLLRSQTLARGRSGVRPAVVEALLALLNAGIVPFVPEHGSLGCSGDLAPLAHMALCLMGEGVVVNPNGSLTDSGAALTSAGLRPLTLEAKEGLSLINGLDGTLGMLLLACEDLAMLLRTADVTAAMSIEAALASDRPFAADLQTLRPHPGQAQSAQNLRRLLEGSEILASHRDALHAVQDAYSMRCTPQVLGAARDTLEFATRIAGRELQAVVDNPVVLEDGRVESNGNFHGAPLGFACDFLAIAAAEAGAIAERRLDRLLDPARSQGLPAFLAAEPGTDSGLMIAQYTAAALVADDRRLAQPASLDSIPTSAMQEDHVSMAWAAARKLRLVIDNLARILAIELVCAARALDLRGPLRPAAATAAVRDLLREHVPGPGPDRYLAPELAAAVVLVRSGAVAERARLAIGELV